jgi:hypothetical protein
MAKVEGEKNKSLAQKGIDLFKKGVILQY